MPLVFKPYGGGTSRVRARRLYKKFYHNTKPLSRNRAKFKRAYERFYDAQSAAHPTARGRASDNGRTARTLVPLKRYYTMPVQKRRRVDVAGWDTKHGYMYALTRGRESYRMHQRHKRHMRNRDANGRFSKRSVAPPSPEL